jgi:hypothetical protein
MPDFTPLELDVLRLLGGRSVRWLDLDHIVAGLEALDGGSAHDRTRVLAALGYLVRARLLARCYQQGTLTRIYSLTEVGARELAARDQLGLFTPPRPTGARAYAG